MNRFILPLNHQDCGDPANCGNKAAMLHQLITQKIKVPEGLCLTNEAYQQFINLSGIREMIVMELSRKNFQEMRWEEIWDASLRIRNVFIKKEIPPHLKNTIEKKIKKYSPETRWVIRSSSNLEDASDRSFAGIHESYVHITGIAQILHHIKLVWASLWSDAAMAYQKELSLNITQSSMAVIIQKLVQGEKSGIVFTANPNNPNQAVIEAVYGLNKGLVDGDIEPDRFFLNRDSGQLISQSLALNKKYCIPHHNGTKILPVPPEKAKQAILDKQDLKTIYKTFSKIEKIQTVPQDIEWTINQKVLYILQSRPITKAQIKDEDTRRSWDLSLRRSYENLRQLCREIENQFIPAMIKEAKQISQRQLKSLNDQALKQEIQFRKNAYEKWKQIYWETFIPFAHGMRLFAEIYNNRLMPDDAYEFMDLISSNQLVSIKRNQMLEDMAQFFQNNPNILTHKKQKEIFEKKLDQFIKKFSWLSCDFHQCPDQKESVKHIIQELAKKPITKKPLIPRKNILLEQYFQAFPKDEQDYAKDLLKLAQKSYQLRDDDNIYLGRFDTLLKQAIEEYKKRKIDACAKDQNCKNFEDNMQQTKFSSHSSKRTNVSNSQKDFIDWQPRQLRGQPAGKGIAKGYARVIKKVSDLNKVKKDDILICDAIDPNMTFVIPLVKGIVERRGGMLIHGAIIAREYGLPCVTGIPKATELIKNNDLITVDGYFGLVIVHSKSEL